MPSTAARPRGSSSAEGAPSTGSTPSKGAAQPVLDEATVQLRDRGVVTLPKALRDRYGLAAGDALRVLDLDGVFVVTPMVPMVPELAREIERLRTEAGLSTKDLLDGLRRERERYARERYGAGTGAGDASDEDTAGTNG